MYEQPFGGNLAGFLKVKLKKVPFLLPYFGGTCNYRTPPPPQKKKNQGFFCLVLTKRSSLEKSSNSGSQAGKDVMTAAAVWSQFLHWPSQPVLNVSCS